LLAKDESKPTDLIQIGYVISIQILEDKRDAMQQRVAVTGEIQMPYIGLMRAAGKTCAELAEEARRQIEPTYLSKATVVVKIDDKSAVKDRIICWVGFPTVCVMGNVQKAGKYDLPTNKNTTVSAQLVRAGGHKSARNEVPKIKIVRTTPQGEKTIVVNTHGIWVEKKTEYDLVLRDNDVMIVE